MLIRLLVLLGVASACCAQPVKTVCVMPIEDNKVVQIIVERIIQANGLQTVDCIAHPGEGDAVLGFFANSRPVDLHEFHFYQSGRSNLQVLRQVYPASGITIWLQSHRVGDEEGSLFIGKMLYYGNAPNLSAGLKKVLRQIKKENL